jgi:hypothetical protein
MVPGCLSIVKKWEVLGHKLSVISKIDPYAEVRVSMSLVYHGIIPHIIDPAEVRFCYERKHKKNIAELTRPDLHIDDRVEPLTAVHQAGVRYKILFTGVADDRLENGKLEFGENDGLFVANTWEEIDKIASSLSLP